MTDIDLEASGTAAPTSAITPALSKDVSFTEKVQAVDDALKSRSAATKDLKQKWAAIIKAFAEYDIVITSRRGDAVQAQNYVNQIVIHKPQNALLDNEEMVKLAKNCGYFFCQFRSRDNSLATRKLEEKFPGFNSYIDEVLDTYSVLHDGRETDKEATKAARDKVQQHVDAYLAALEAYDETIESVANVKEYIAVVKDVAEISAIAQGALAPKS